MPTRWRQTDTILMRTFVRLFFTFGYCYCYFFIPLTTADSFSNARLQINTRVMFLKVRTYIFFYVFRTAVIQTDTDT